MWFCFYSLRKVIGLVFESSLSMVSLYTASRCLEHSAERYVVTSKWE